VHSCIIHVNVIIIFVIVCGLIEWKLTCAGFVIACYIYIAIEVQLSRAVIPLNGVPFEFWMFTFLPGT
jgi:hypothetical protein